MKFKINKGGELGTYYYQKNDIVYGPVKIDELLENIDGDTLVYKEGNTWAKANENIELKKYFVSSTSQFPNKVVSRKPNAIIPPETEPAVASSSPPNVNTNSKNRNWVIFLVLFVAVIAIIYLTNNNFRSNNLASITDSVPGVIIDSSKMLLGEADVYQALSSKYIDQDQLNRISYSDVVNYQNELLARHGYIFEDPNIRNYFVNKPWYTPKNNYLIATSGFSLIEKSNYDLLELKNSEIKNKIIDIIHSYYYEDANQTFDANNYYAARVEKYIKNANVTPTEINELNRKSEDFINPKFQFNEPLELKYEKGSDGVDYFYFKVFFGVFRPSKQKFQSCYINFKWGLNDNFKIVSNQELSYDNLKFTDDDNFNFESPDGLKESSNWVVILGSFQDERNASGLMERCSASGISVELLSTNSFQYLPRNYFIVTSGKNLSKLDAVKVGIDLKRLGIENHIKNVGEMQ